MKHTRLTNHGAHFGAQVPAFQLPPPPPGMQWHRKDGWEEGDLPQGWRPLALGEEEHDEDEFGSRINNAWMPTPDSGKVVGAYYKVRTRRPLTFEHEGKTWTYHRPGDPMPCDGERAVYINFRDGSCCDEADKAQKFDWSSANVCSDIIGWRYADEKKTVPLGPEDVPPGSVFGRHDRIVDTWHQVIGVYKSTIKLPTYQGTYAYEQLTDDWLINRSLPLTGKWNPDAWEPCSKEVAV